VQIVAGHEADPRATFPRRPYQRLQQLEAAVLHERGDDRDVHRDGEAGTDAIQKAIVATQRQVSSARSQIVAARRDDVAHLRGDLRRRPAGAG
jgi:hypothetical protein